MFEILKKTFSKNNNEIQLIKACEFCANEQNSHAQTHPPKTILIIGVFHGEEPQGKFLIENYIASFAPSPQPSPRMGEGDCSPICPRHLRKMAEFQGEERALEIRGKGKNNLLFIPCLNPDGMASNKRQNANGIDLNRNFPTKNWAKVKKNSDYYGGENPACEIETKFVMEILAEFSPDIILTIHAPYKVVNFDGPAKEIAEKISEIIKYPVSNDIGYATPGSFGNYAGVERNIPTITLELDEQIDTKELIKPLNEIFEYLSDID